MQRLKFTDDEEDGTGWVAGASFLRATTSSTVTCTATTLSDALLNSLGKASLCGWQFSTTGYAVSSTLPLYLSFDIGPGMVWDDIEIWQYNGSAWSEYDVNDLAYDGTYASFTATSLGSGFAVVVPEPGTLAMLAAGLTGLWVLARRRRA